MIKLSLIIYLLWFRFVLIGVLRMISFVLVIFFWKVFSVVVLCFRIRFFLVLRFSFIVKDKKELIRFFFSKFYFYKLNKIRSEKCLV